MSNFISIVLLCILILLNGFYAMTETALVACRRARLEPLAEDGDKKAADTLRMLDNPTVALSTMQAGITVIGILLGIIGESAVAGPIASVLAYLGLDAAYSRWVSLVIAVALITYFSIIFGELFPKRIGQMAPELIMEKSVGILRAHEIIGAPFIKLLAATTNWLLRHLLGNRAAAPSVTEDEINAVIEQGQQTGVIDQQERDMVINVFRLDDRQVNSLMTPRSEIEWINLEDPQQMNIDKILTSQRSRLVVASGSLDDVKGICSTPKLMKQILQTGRLNFSEALVPANYVPETLTGKELLEQFRRTDAPLSLVVNEYGEIQGIVTPRDVLEAIAGQFKPEKTDDQWAVERPDGSWLLDGIISIPDLKDRLALKDVPEEEDDRYSTLAGMVMLLLGKLPKVGDAIEWEGWRLEVVDMDGRRIDKVLATPLGKGAGQAPAPSV
ncbi:hemolysin family protein [Mesosutterella sp. OilRF-GAM-744-9]|uniref:Hemolysin family protein n=1 Tax=Mesosutterella porci TaxID=2915351 RepID=A0ABS9MRJ0_9BURK|nr:hemolysin family protein [Mesosutterella sp. oilRF-744-WT-GAM-9]MCG5031241.1 hemolysin family protein [Mesosutterella sp. oilRF-744-WT-GAM-9]